MKCVICKLGTTHHNKAGLTVEKEGAFLVFSNVEADVCNNCGEAYFDADTARQLQRMAAEEFKKGKPIELVKL